jgi:tRNA modification GTPase
MAALRTLKNPKTADPIDRVLVLYFPAPHSFTGEDVVEFHAHGSRAVTNVLTECLSALPHFRLAEPGEFTRRAFENGKMDLTEAEAVADLVHAETEAQRKQALRQMDGELSKLYEDWRLRLSRGLAYMEAAIDFSDEELPADMIDKQTASLRDLRDEIQAHLNDNHRGERIRDGFSIAIIGSPNAGKSSLLNALARREAAIVSPTAGTTRDVIEVHLDIGGYAVTLADTAGLRDSADAIESEGIRRAHTAATQADLKLLVIDATAAALDSALENLIDADTLIVINKCDLRNDDDARDDSLPPAGRVREGGVTLGTVYDWRTRLSLEAPLPNPPREGEGIPFSGTNLSSLQEASAISATIGTGIDTLLKKLTHEIARRMDKAGPPPLTRARHREALILCAGHLDRAVQAPMADLRAEDVRLAMRALGRITGRVDVEDLLDIIFRDFCIGK